MTVAEAKVNEFANKILDFIEQSEEQHADPKWIVQGVKGYICGMSDGIEFAEEMRGPDHDTHAKTSEEVHSGWKPEGRSKIEDFLDKQTGEPEAKCAIEIR